MSEQITTWQPFDSAPKEPFELDWNMDIGGRSVRLRMGTPFMGRGALDGEMLEHRICWSQKNDEPGRWWNINAEEPLDLPLTEWRPLTAEEDADEGATTAEAETVS